MTAPIGRAVILARGLGTRMRQADPGAALTRDQARIAEQGVKGMIPMGRPFMDYILSALADAGYDEVCLVIGPEHDLVRDYYTKVARQRLKPIAFAIQAKPRGTADAVLAAEQFAGSGDFLVLNSDNYYPVDACRRLREIAGPGLAAFAPVSLVEGGIPLERVNSFPRIAADQRGCLRALLEFDPASNARVSMNCWRFSPRIFAACRAIAPSPRGEWELPDAVHHAINQGECFRVLESDQPVLDVSSRADIAGVAERLRTVAVRL